MGNLTKVWHSCRRPVWIRINAKLHKLCVLCVIKSSLCTFSYLESLVVIFSKRISTLTQIGVPGCTSTEWLAGTDGKVFTGSMDPALRTDVQATEMVVKKTYAELEAELAAAKKRIAELEAQVAAA